MKVLNYTTSYFAVVLLVLISVWAAIFYYAFLDEIYDSIDDGLDNQKGLIIQKAATDSTILLKNNFEEGDYAIREVSPDIARSFHDISLDTMMYMQNEKDFEPVRMLRTVFHHKGQYYQMDVITSMVEEDDLIAELFYALLWLYAGLVATILLINNFLLKRIWRPFYFLLKQIKKFKLEEPDVPAVMPTRIDEFRMLNERVQKLLKDNIDAYNSQKHFIENASHELQTPLAISINKLEALAESANLSEEQLKLLSSALDNLERLTRLNKSLLLLSKIENKQFLEEGTISINELVRKATNDFGDQLAYSNISLQIEEKDTALVQMNPDLASILVLNLVKNAIVHNYRNGMLGITITADELIVENTGQDTPLNERLLFLRFSKENPAESSTGLGLAIVKAIAGIYSFTISYSFHARHRLHVHFRKSLD